MTAGPLCQSWERNGSRDRWQYDCEHDSCWAIVTGGLRQRARPATRPRRGLRAAVRDALWRLSDRLCARGTAEGTITCRPVFEAGHLAGETGWKLRETR